MHRLLLVCLGVLALAAEPLGGFQTGDDAPTVLGALLDTPPFSVSAGGRQIRIFDGARNEVYRREGALSWRKMSYFYDPPLELARAESGQPQIQVFPSPLGNTDIVQFDLQLVPVSRAVLAAAVRNSQRNPYAEESQLQPLMVFRVEVSILNLPPVVIDTGGGQTFETPLSIQVAVPGGKGHDVANALRSGLAIRVRLQTLTKLTQLTQLRATWRDVVHTKVYQDFLGPAGPQFVTAAQADRLSSQISNELGLFQWQEGSPSTYQSIVKQLSDRLFDTRHRTELRLEEAGDPRKLRIDVSGLQVGQGDLIRRIATDAANLNDDEWCRKYSQSSNSERTNSDKFSGGVDVFDIFGADVDTSSSSSAKQAQASASQDCGKHRVQSSFKYEFDGEKRIPKSVYVHNVTNGSGSVTDSTELFGFTVGQKYGFIEKTVTSKSSP